MADRRRWGAWGTAAAALLVLAAMLWFGDVGSVLATLRGLDPWALAGALGLVTVAYALRFGKWHLFVRTLRLPVPAGRSLQVFLAGLMMVVTPAKVGEVWKSVLLAGDGIPVARSLPAVAMERFLDLLAVSLLAVAGLAVLAGATWAAPATLALAALALLALRWTRLWHGLLDRLARWRRAARAAAFLRTAYDGAHRLATPRPLALGGAIALAAWSLEGASLWLLLEGLGVEVSPATAIAAFCLGTLAGVASLLPGGLGTTEAGMVAILVAQGVPDGAAVAATLLARACTLGYGAALGAVASLAWARPGESAPQDGGVVDAERPGDALQEPLDRP